MAAKRSEGSVRDVPDKTLMTKLLCVNADKKHGTPFNEGRKVLMALHTWTYIMRDGTGKIIPSVKLRAVIRRHFNTTPGSYLLISIDFKTRIKINISPAYYLYTWIDFKTANAISIPHLYVTCALQ